MTKKKFKDINKEKLEIKAFLYLTGKQGKKGKEIRYEGLKMADYLMPGEQKLSIKNKRDIFSMRNRMVDISENFPVKKEKEKCACGEKETMKHIYTCKYLNYEEQTTEYEEMFSENVYNQKKILERFNKNM